MSFNGDTPLQITWEKRGDEFYVPVKASEATINILCRDNFHYLSLFTSDPRQFRVSILRNKQLYWRGFVTADLYSENFTAPPYQVCIKAVDGFNLLSSIPFRDLLGIGITGRCSLWRLLTACTDLMELDVDTADWMDLYADEQNGLEADERTILKFSRVVDVALVVFPAYQDTEASVRHLEERKTEWVKAHELQPQPDAERIRRESRSRERLVETLKLK